MNIRLNEARERFEIGSNVVKQKRNADKDPVNAFIVGRKMLTI